MLYFSAHAQAQAHGPTRAALFFFHHCASASPNGSRYSSLLALLVQKYKYWQAAIALVKTPRAPFIFYSLLALFCFLFITLTSPSVEVITLNAPIMRAHVTLCTLLAVYMCLLYAIAHPLCEHTLLSVYMCLLWPRQHTSACVSIYHSTKRAHITLCLYLSFLATSPQQQKKSLSLCERPWETENAVEEQESAL